MIDNARSLFSLRAKDLFIEVEHAMINANKPIIKIQESRHKQDFYCYSRITGKWTK